MAMVKGPTTPHERRRIRCRALVRGGHDARHRGPGDACSCRCGRFGEGVGGRRVLGRADVRRVGRRDLDEPERVDLTRRGIADREERARRRRRVARSFPRGAGPTAVERREEGAGRGPGPGGRAEQRGHQRREPALAATGDSSGDRVYVCRSAARCRRRLRKCRLPRRRSKGSSRTAPCRRRSRACRSRSRHLA